MTQTAIEVIHRPDRRDQEYRFDLVVVLNMTRIGIIGAGNIGSTVARLAVNAGYEVLVSNSRGPETLGGLIAELGPLAAAVTPAEAASAGDLVVVTIPLGRIAELPLAELAGKTVIDTNNYYPERDGRIQELDEGGATTSELLQRLLPDSNVVKGFNNIIATHLAQLARPEGAADRSVLPIAGDSAEAKSDAAAFISAVGYDVFDAGDLSEGRRFERGHPAYCEPYAADPEALRASVPGARPVEAQPASRDVIARLVAAG